MLRVDEPSGEKGHAQFDIEGFIPGTYVEESNSIRFETNDPAYLVVEVRRGLGKRYPIVPCALVTRTDRMARCVHLRGRCRTLRRLPETIPIVV